MASRMSIRVDGLSKRFGDKLVIDDVSFVAADGEFVSLLGPSGCGKTTTLRCVAGLEAPDAGRIEIGGRVVFDAAQGRVGAAAPAQPRHGVPVLRHLAAPERVRERRLPAADPQAGEGRDRPPGRRGAGPRGPGRPRPAQVVGAVGRPAAARRRGAGHRAVARCHAARRAAEQPRRQAARPHARRDPPPAARARHRRHVRDPRPGRGAGAVGPRAGHARGPRRAGGYAAPDLRAARQRVRRRRGRRGQLPRRRERADRCGQRAGAIAGRRRASMSAAATSPAESGRLDAAARPHRHRACRRGRGLARRRGSAGPCASGCIRAATSSTSSPSIGGTTVRVFATARSRRARPCCWGSTAPDCVLVGGMGQKTRGQASHVGDVAAV